MASPVYRLQDPQQAKLNPFTFENIKLYTKEIVGLPEIHRCDITRSKWNDFYQELEHAVSTFGSKGAVLILAA